MHTCNPWCFGGIHALLFDSELTDRAARDQVGNALAAQEGLRFVGVSEVQAQGTPPAGTRTSSGIVRGRLVVWAAGA